MRKQWTLKKIQTLFNKPFFDTLFEAQTIHRKYFNPNQIQISTLLSIKTGLCPEDCKYCPQSARYKTNIKKEKLLPLNKILKSAHIAKKSGSSRFCMGAAWTSPKEKNMDYLETIIKEVKKLGMETCMTLGMLKQDQANRLAKAGLDFYNHNLDTSKDYYNKVVTTRSYQERLDTLEIVRQAGIKVCSGGILGLGETVTDRIKLLLQLSNLSQVPESIPINMLIKVKGTPMEYNDNINAFDFIRTIAVTRIMMPKSYIRLSAGRANMNEQTQAMCFMAGANSVFYGCKLLTASNPETNDDLKLFNKLGLITKIKNNTLEINKNQYQFLKENINIQQKKYYNAEKK